MESNLSQPQTAHVTQPPRLGVLGTIAMILMIVGGLNWALVGLFEFDLVAALFGVLSPLSRIVYVLVGLAAVYGLALLARLSSAR
ncbi:MULTISPECIES: DUF378 domain-containing protein [Gulbenkiania]|uniref:Uncharacterized membrane protein YuzA, DUF378 family n=2 Tax=Gulbenkiania TaxID=397456 RepID=A0A0K6GUC5_9NEIS|nr:MULTISPECIES: DUF378 domain-containing protein [Gulbenkiania]TCW33838.1 hypothetical protein EV669_101375 [Gulbenkiania mobilis]CUA82208.1 Uncharacterized membrane protein YuzA, DUF378 family [Gulbenkiania indica]